MNYVLPTDVNSDYVVRNNVVKGPQGIAVFSTIDEASTCLIKNNDLRWVTDTPIFTSEGAEACVLHNNRE